MFSRQTNTIPNYNGLINPSKLFNSMKTGSAYTGTVPTRNLNNQNSASTGISFKNGSPVFSQALQQQVATNSAPNAPSSGYVAESV